MLFRRILSFLLEEMSEVMITAEDESREKKVIEITDGLEKDDI